jgi:uncharacterized protein YbjT (DUF2867 family)
MAAESERVVTVFGGTGFLGRRVVQHLRLHAFYVRIASRHPSRHALLHPDDPQLQSIKVDVHDERSVADALADAYGAVNAVSLYSSTDGTRFIPFTSNLPNGSQLRRSKLESSGSFRKRGEGELAVRAGFADTILIRPAVMFGPDDAFLTAEAANYADDWQECA